MRNDTRNGSSLDSVLNGVHGSSVQISTQLENYKTALDRLATSPFVSKMRKLQSNIL